MAHYVFLYKFTEAGQKSLKQSPDRVARLIQAAEKMGAKNITVRYVMGEYDLISLGEMPDDETAAKIATMIAAEGNTKPMTLRAFTPDEFRNIVAELPG